MATDKAFWVEFFPINPATGTAVRIRMCTLNTAEATGIDLANGEWMPYMTSFPDVEISVFDGEFDGVSEATVSGVEASDTNGFGSLFPSYIWDGTPVTVYKGTESSTTLGSLTKIFSGSVTETPSNEEGEIKWSIRDKSYLFDVEAFKTTYAGTTGYEGTAEMKGVSKPFAIGEVLNLEPFLVDPAYLIYQYHGYGRTIGVQGLYENGLGFGAGQTPVAWAGSVAATYAALKAVTLVAGQWVDAPSIGMFRLGGEPLQGGVITCDVKGQEKSAGVLCERLDDVLALLVSQDSNLSALVDGTTYSTVFAGSNNQTVGDYFTGPINIGEVMAKYLSQCGAYYFVSSAGLLRFGFVRMGTPALEIRSDGTTLPVPESVSSASVSAPYKRMRMGADKVFKVHSLDEISDALYQAVHQLQIDLTAITEDFYLAVDDDNLTIQEKIQIAIPTNTQYGNQYIELRARAIALGLSVTAIDAAYTAYTTDRNAISPAWNDTTQNSTGIPATFRANVAALGAALVALSVDISEEDAKRANWGTVGSRPTELTDGRIAIGIRPTGALQGEVWGGAAAVKILELMEAGLVGKSLSIDPDFSKGVLPSNYGVYDNAAGGKTTAAIVNDSTAPNGSGKILRVSYDGTGTPNSNPNPGFGGVVQTLISAGSGLSRPAFYSPGTRIAFIISAKIPVGRNLEQASNLTGSDGFWEWITDTAGTGTYRTYIGIRTIGTTGTFSSTGFLFVKDGANTAFSWDIARYEQREIASAALPQLNRLIDAVGTLRADNELITLQGTSASIVGQGPGATASANDVLNYIDGTTISTVRAPSGGQFTYDNTITGIIKISLPLGFSNTMVQFRISVFDYQAGASVTYVVSGYTYSATSGTDGFWVNCSAQYIGPEGYARRVRFGFDGTKCCVWIGELSTTWQYPKVTVSDVMVGYQNTTATNWKSGWVITINEVPPNNSSPTYFGIIPEVVKPRPGDAVFGEGIYETAGGAAASLANFKTQLGTAAAILSQGALATLNQVANAQIANSAITAIKFLVDSGVDLASIVPGSLNWRLSSSSSTDYSGGGWNGSGYNPAIDSGIIGVTGAVNASTGHRCTMKVDLTVTQTAPTGGTFDGYIEAYYRINGGSWVATGYKKRSGSTVSQWSGNDTFNVPSAGTIEFGYRLTSTGPNSGSLGDVNIVDHSLIVEGIFWK